MMPSIKKLDHRLIISTPLLLRIVTLSLYTKNIIVDRQTQQVLIRFRYLWFITSAEVIPFQEIQRIDYSCESTMDYQTRYRNHNSSHSSSVRVENDVFNVRLVLNKTRERIEVARFSGPGNSSIDDNASREFAHTLQQLTNLPLTEPGLNIPEDGGLFSLLEPDLQKVLELCCMYLVSLDEEFTPDEQNWVDDKFGLGTSERFINEMSGINWKICFSEIHERLRALTPRDQIYAKTQARHLFQKLMEADELKGIEQERLDHLMGFIREAFYQDE